MNNTYKCPECNSDPDVNTDGNIDIWEIKKGVYELYCPNDDCEINSYTIDTIEG